MATDNYWNVNPPTASLFLGSVAWSYYQPWCPSGSGFPGFWFGQNGEPEETALGSSTPLKAPFPNPANPRTCIEFTTPDTGERVGLSIYDVAGRAIAELYTGEADGDPQRLWWHGLDRSGRKVGAGVYFVRLSIGGRSFNEKLILVQ